LIWVKLGQAKYHQWGESSVRNPDQWLCRHRSAWGARAFVGLALLTLAITGCASGGQLTGPQLTPTATAKPSRPSLDQRIDNYIATLSTQQLIGQTLMMAVYADSYNSNLDQALTQWDIGNAVVFTNYNGGPTQPSSLDGMRQLVSGLQSHATTPLLLAIDEEGGEVDRLANYYGGTPSPQQLSATGDPQQAHNQAQTDAQRMRQLGFNVDFAPLADVWQGGAIDESRTFGTTVGQVTTYAGAFLDGLQQNGVAGTLKHWPGLGASTANPDFGLAEVSRSQAQLNATDFASFRTLLSHHPDLIMVTAVIVRAYDPNQPASLSSILIQQVLRDQLGYQGVVVTDAMNAQGVIDFMAQQGYTDPAQGVAEACVRAFVAGADLIEAPIEQDRLAATVAAMTQAVQSGRITQARLHDAVHRIIRLKVELGLMTV
jgi:beta-N-acetylhexosaminidase